MPIGKEHLAGFHAALDSVAREGRYLAMLQAPPYAPPGASCSTASRAARFTSSRSPATTWSAGATCGRRRRSTLRHSAVLGMGVVREYRGQGLGSRMLATTLEMAEARGLGRVELVVRADNEAAIALYRRFGFVEEGRCRQYLRLDGVGHDALLMARLASDPAR